MPRKAREFQQPPGPILDPDDPLVLRATARLMADQEEATAAYATDPWAFVRDCVWTRDEAIGAIRRFPNKPYLEHLTMLWQREALLAVPKSRRLLLTWLFVTLGAWLVRFHPNVKVAFMARKEGKTESEGSAELVRRAKYILEAVPPLFAPVELDYHHGYLGLSNGSEILGLGQGADQARQHAFTYVLCDEVGFWEQGWETWVALRPTIEGGGRITLISTAEIGFWKDLVHDQLH